MRLPIPDGLRPTLRIGAVAELLHVHRRTLRVYEERGLITPARLGRQRRYTPNDVRWLRCLRAMLHEDGCSLAGISQLLDLTPCWDIRNCPPQVRDNCDAKVGARLTCWGVMEGRCTRDALPCLDCNIYQTRDKTARSR